MLLDKLTKSSDLLKSGKIKDDLQNSVTLKVVLLHMKCDQYDTVFRQMGCLLDEIGPNELRSGLEGTEP